MTPRPSEVVKQVISGELALTEAPEGLQLWLSHVVYLEACAVLAIRTKQARREHLEALPELYRKEVKREVIALHNKRKR